MSKHHLLLSEGVAEVTSMAVGTGISSKNHPANLGLITGVPHHRSQLRNAMSKLAVITIWARSSLLPLVTQLCLEHPLTIHLELQWLFLFLNTRQIHSLWHLRKRDKIAYQ